MKKPNRMQGYVIIAAVVVGLWIMLMPPWRYGPSTFIGFMFIGRVPEAYTNIHFPLLFTEFLVLLAVAVGLYLLFRGE